MTYQYLLQLPQYLEPALKAGKIVIESGVARDVGTKAIVAHLEMAQAAGPKTLGDLGFINPVFAAAGLAIKTVNDTTKLNKIIHLTQEVKTLSTINIAISGTTLGVATAGFAIVIYQLEKLDKKLNDISSQIRILDAKVSELIKHELSKLVADVRRHIKDCITLIHQMEDLGWSEYLDNEVSKLFNSIESLIEMLIGKHLDRDEINVSLDLIQCLQSAYANLLKAYLTKRYLQGKNLAYPALRLQTLENFSQQLCSPDILDELYEQYLLSKEYKFTEGELDIILDLYRYGCRNTSNNVNVHHEILQVTPQEKFNHWQHLLKDNNKPFIWLEH